jgi:tRNA(Ile)-lysidine synthetase-like protein
MLMEPIAKPILVQNQRQSWFCNFWLSSPTLWFQSSDEPDAIVKCMCEDLLGIGDTCILGNVILYDQIPRHIFRGQQANHIIDFFLERSLYYLKHVCTEELTDIEWVFAMLPYRHKGIKILEVINTAWERYVKSESPIIKRFIKACYTRMEPSFNLIAHPHFQFANVTKDNGFDSIQFQDILGFSPLRPFYKDAKSEHPINDAFQKFNFPNVPIILSLSGGVDSMVCSHCLKQANIRMVALHVNYNNRSAENAIEENFVRAWCDYMGIDLHVLRIEEINRKLCIKYEMRDIYEKYTRSRRLTAYKLITEYPHVILGHNKDDVFENIMTNIASQNRIENLDGMTCESVEDGITFYRPMLAVPKEHLISYARRHSIPYLKNSTPKWSQRGRIRDKVVPMLDEWNINFKEGLHHISQDMTNISSFIRDVAKRSDLSNLPRTKCLTFWRCIFEKINPSKKSLTHFIEKLDKEGPFRVMIKKDTMITIDITEQCVSLKFT